MSALSDLLNRHIEDKFRELSNRQIAKAAGISRGTVDNYRAGKIPGAPKEEVLQAFHDLLGIPLAELRAAAGVPRGEPEPYKAPAEFNRLSQAQRDALDEFVRSFVGPQGASHADQSRLAVASAPPGASVQAAEGEEARRMIVRMSTGPDAGQIRLLTRDEFENMPQGWFYDVLGATTPDMEDATAFALGEALAKLLDEKRQDSPPPKTKTETQAGGSLALDVAWTSQQIEAIAPGTDFAGQVTELRRRSAALDTPAGQRQFHRNVVTLLRDTLEKVEAAQPQEGRRSQSSVDDAESRTAGDVLGLGPAGGAVHDDEQRGDIRGR